MIGVEATAGSTPSTWVRTHADVLGVARERAGLEAREGATLLRAFREAVHRHLGYGAFAEYSDRYLGHGHRTTQDKLRTAEALERLPELARALQEGQLHASAVRELTRVATRETEADWIAAAAGRRVREIERLVAGRARGDRPGDAPRPELERHVLRFEVSGETLAAFREAMAWLREQSGEALDDDTALLMLARSVLCGAGAEMQSDAPAATSTTAARAAATQPAATTRPVATEAAGALPAAIEGATTQPTATQLAATHPAVTDAAAAEAAATHPATEASAAEASATRPAATLATSPRSAAPTTAPSTPAACCCRARQPRRACATPTAARTAPGSPLLPLRTPTSGRRSFWACAGSASRRPKPSGRWPSLLPSRPTRTRVMPSP